MDIRDQAYRAYLLSVRIPALDRFRHQLEVRKRGWQLVQRQVEAHVIGEQASHSRKLRGALHDVKTWKAVQVEVLEGRVPTPDVQFRDLGLVAHLEASQAGKALQLTQVFEIAYFSERQVP